MSFFEDPLFIRTGSGLVPTAAGVDIYTQLQKPYNVLISNIESLKLSESKDILLIHCPKYIAIRIMPVVTIWVEEHAPHCKVIHRDFLKGDDSTEELLQLRGVDLAFDVFPSNGYALQTVPLYDEESTFICRVNHPRLGSSISREEAQLEKFTLFESGSLAKQVGQLQIQKKFGDRAIATKSNSLMTIVSMVEQSNIIGNIPVWLYEKLKNSYGIRRLEQPFKANVVTTYMMFHKNSLRNAMLRELTDWLEQHFEGQ